MLRPLVLALAFVCPALHAGDVYVWVDKEGRKQISDVVPERYRSKATQIWAPEPPAPVVESRSAAAGGSAAPIPQAAAANDCNLRWQLYRDSRECLDFYEDPLRGFDAEGHASCPIVAPPRDCPAPPTGISSK